MRNALNILIVSNFAPPQNNIAVGRIHSWIRDWSKQGHQVTVLTTKKVRGLDGNLDGDNLSANYDPNKVNFIELPYHNESRDYDFADKITHRHPPARFSLRRSLRALFPFLLDQRAIWAVSSLKKIKQIIGNQRFDVIVSSFPLSYCHIIAFIISKRFNIPWLADYRDPWSCDRMRRGPWPFYLIDYVVEKILISQASRITAVSPGQADLIGNWLGRKVDVVYNGSDDPTFAENNSFRKLASTDKFRIRYLGTIYSPNQHGYCEFFDALAKLKQSSPKMLSNLSVEFIGPGTNQLNPLISERKLERWVTTQPTVSLSKARELMATSEALLFFDLKRQNKVPGVLSGKIFEYFSARRPILSICDDQNSDANNLIKLTYSGLFFDFSDPNSSFESAIKRLENYTKSTTPNYIYLYQYRRDIQSQVMLNLLEHL